MKNFTAKTIVSLPEFAKSGPIFGNFIFGTKNIRNENCVNWSEKIKSPSAIIGARDILFSCVKTNPEFQFTPVMEPTYEHEEKFCPDSNDEINDVACSIQIGCDNQKEYSIGISLPDIFGFKDSELESPTFVASNSFGLGPLKSSIFQSGLSKSIALIDDTDDNPLTFSNELHGRVAALIWNMLGPPLVVCSRILCYGCFTFAFAFSAFLGIFLAIIFVEKIHNRYDFRRW